MTNQYTTRRWNIRLTALNENFYQLFSMYVMLSWNFDFCFDRKARWFKLLFVAVNFHEFCGSTITKNAGQLQFDARKLPSYLPGSKCSVTISLQSSMLNSRTQVLFYFTKFDISMFCEDTNVTAVDGTQYSRTQIAGRTSVFVVSNLSLWRYHDPVRVVFLLEYSQDVRYSTMIS